MERNTISLANAKARLSELADLAASGETVVITKRGKPVAQLSKVETPRRPVDLAALREVTERMPLQEEGAAEFMRRLRDDERY